MPPQACPRLIGFDLDGTLIDAQDVMPSRTRAALLELHRAGVQLAFLTGRRPLTARPKLDDLGLPGFTATNSGCLLWELPGWRQIGRQLFPAELVVPVAELLAPYSANFYVDASHSGFEFYCLQRQASPELELHLARYGANARCVSDPAEIDGAAITQVALPAPVATVAELQRRVTAQYDGQLLALSVRWPLMPAQALELFHPLANKGAALAQFARRLGVDRRDVLAIGDDTNDLAMLEWAGWSVAMPHAQAEVRAAARETLADGADPLADYLAGLLAATPRAPRP